MFSAQIQRLPLTRELAAKPSEGETLNRLSLFSLPPSKPAVLPPPSSEGGFGWDTKNIKNPQGQNLTDIKKLKNRRPRLWQESHRRQRS